MVDRILAVSGLHLDRAWTEHDPPLGQLLRERSFALLGELVAAGHDRSCSTLVIVGDLVDRTCVRQGTLNLVGTVLREFPGQVLIVPGLSDWFSADSPYAVTPLPDNVHVFRSADWTDIHGIAGSAWTDPAGTGSPTASAFSRPARIAVRAGAATSPAGLHLLTTGTEPASGPATTVVPPTLTGPGLPHGPFAVLDVSPDDVLVDFITPETAGSTTRELDASDLASSTALERALAAISRECAPLDVIRVTGLLRQGVLLPHFTGSQPPRDDIVVEWAVTPDIQPAPPEDRSVRAELVRAMVEASRPPLERHQSLALALRALSDDEGA